MFSSGSDITSGRIGCVSGGMTLWSLSSNAMISGSSQFKLTNFLLPKPPPSKSDDQYKDVLDDDVHDKIDNNAEDETDSILEHLARQFSPQESSTSNAPAPAQNLNGRLLYSSKSQLEEELDTILPTIENYKQQVDEWPPARIAVVDRSQKKKLTAGPPRILNKARAIQKLYKQHKSLLAIMGNVSKFTMDKALGELGGCRRPSGYQIWLKFGQGKGQNGVLSSRNKILGDLWNSLPDRHQEVFLPHIFHALSGLSYSHQGNKLDNEEEKEKSIIEFEPGEHQELQALYDKIVWKEKVAKEYSKAVKGIPPAPTLPDYNQQSLKSIERLSNQIEDESKNLGFDYYLLACSTHSSTEVGASSRGWCKEYTSLEEMSKYVNKKSNFAIMFAARSQGLSVGEIVAETIGVNGMLTERARKADAGDVVKTQLALALRQRMTALLGYEIGFPCGPNPEGILLDKGYNLKILQLPGSKLLPETFKLGFTAMNSCRSLWLDDVNQNLFKLEKIATLDQTADDENQMAMDEGITNTQEITLADEAVEEEEWTGLGSLTDR
ncbi:hypothetical protein DFH28DRAFT_1090418 [Melampsora americana]|nr:hypothetical protein DFH28DRAFT_1090418 [Melampsora americana]